MKSPLPFMVEFDFNLSFTIRWELEDKNFLKIDNICLDDSVKYRIMAIKTNENFITFSNSVTFRKPRGMNLVTASKLIPGFYWSKSNVPTPGSLRTMKSPTGGIVSGIKSPPCPCAQIFFLFPFQFTPQVRRQTGQSWHFRGLYKVRQIKLNFCCIHPSQNYDILFHL